MPAFNEVSTTQLMRLIGTPDCPDIIDVRIPEDVAAIPVMVPTARLVDFKDHANLASDLRKDRAVIICHKGKKLSHGVAASLRAQGIAAEVLEGGMVNWKTAGLPAVPVKTLHQVSDLWVTRHRPKIDRIACPWLIQRFVNPNAQFLFVPPAEVDDVADRFGATPFDMEDGDWSHRDDRCTFDLMIERFGLSCTPLQRLAMVVRAADTNQHHLAPEAAGLLAISAGLSRQYKDDSQQLKAGFAIYDALYRWARDAHTEGHDWPKSSGEK